ncbi:MAG: AAA family ATPase [Candidatus Altiarchaeota archaeon]|nr:AAA family ATPase [Candidatus Altiarchaeota archaeon]
MLKFVNREAELWQLKNILGSAPNSVLFVYGPKSSGKSTLMMKISKMYPGDILFYDFRARSPSEVHRVLANQKPSFGTRMRNYLRRKVQKDNIYDGIELTEAQLQQMARGKVDAFAPLINKLKKYKNPVLVLDEIQNLVHSGLDGQELAQLMNFLITITKRLHLAHVIIVTSDCLFIDEIAKKAAMEEAAEYLYVGDLPKSSVIEWMKDEGMSQAMAAKTYSLVGGRPYDLWVIVNHFRATNDINVIETMVRRKSSRVKLTLKSVGAQELRFIRKLAKGPLSITDISKKVMEWAIDNEIAFFDPVNGEVYALSKSMQEALKKV